MAAKIAKEIILLELIVNKKEKETRNRCAALLVLSTLRF